MNKRTIKLTESDLKNIIKESVNSIIENEELLDEGFLDNLNFLGRSGANAAKNIYNKTKEVVNKDNIRNKYNQAKNTVNDYRNQMNQYSQNKDMARTSAKYQKMVINLANDIQEFLEMDIFRNIPYAKQAQEQGKIFLKILNNLANKGFGGNATYYKNNANKMFK